MVWYFVQIYKYIGDYYYKCIKPTIAFTSQGLWCIGICWHNDIVVMVQFSDSKTITHVGRE